MKDRLITAGGALLALFVVYYLFFQPSGEAPMTRPTSDERGRNGYFAVSSWLEQGGLRVASLRERFDVLLDDASGFAERGNVLVTTLPNVHPIRDSEHPSLQAWIREGNTLLVLATLDDTPEWAAGTAEEFTGQLLLLTGLAFRPGGGDADAGDGGPDAGPGAAGAFAPPIPRDTPVEIVPAGTHPLMDGVDTLRGHSDGPSQLWLAMPSDWSRLYLRLGAERTSGFDAIWQTPEGSGQIILVGVGSLLTNHLVAEAGAAQLVANVVRRHLADGGAVIFDDMHQGLSVLYDPAAFYADPRLHYSIAFLIGAWLVYLLGSSNRLAPPAAPRNEPSQATFLGAVGGFMARRLDRRDAGLLLLEEWFDEIRRGRGLPKAVEPPWDALRATPTLSARIREQLRADYARLKGGRAVDLVRLHNTLFQARKAIG